MTIFKEVKSFRRDRKIYIIVIVFVVVVVVVPLSTPVLRHNAYNKDIKNSLRKSYLSVLSV